MARKPKPAAGLATDEAANDMIDRLAEQREQATAIAADTLTGDLRDFVLSRLRYEQDKRPWDQRSEQDQKDTIHQVDQHCRGLVEQAVQIIAGAGHKAIRATLASVSIKDDIKGTIVLSKFSEQRHQLADAVNSSIIIFIADPDAFQGERAPAKVNPDQGDIEHTLAVHSTAEDNHAENPLD